MTIYNIFFKIYYAYMLIELFYCYFLLLLPGSLQIWKLF